MTQLLRPLAGQATYLAAAHQHFLDAGGRWAIAPYVSYDATFVPAVMLLLRCCSDARSLGKG